MNKLDNDSSEKRRMTKKCLVITVSCLLIAGIGVGAGFGIKKGVDDRSFSEQADQAYDLYYQSLIASDTLNMGNLKTVYSDGTRYQVYLGKNNKTYLGTWNRSDNTFSDDKTHNYLMDVNSLGFRIIVNVGSFKSDTSSYRLNSNTDMIPASSGTALTMLEKDGTIDFHTKIAYWGTPVFYDGDSVQCKYDPAYRLTDGSKLFNAGFESLYEANYPGDSLYQGDQKSSWARVFSSQEEVTVLSSKEGDSCFPSNLQKVVFPSYDDFCSAEESYFHQQGSTPFSPVISLTIADGIKQIGDGKEGALSAFNHLTSLSIKSTDEETIDSSYVFGKQETSQSPLTTLDLGNPMVFLSVADHAFSGLKALRKVSFPSKTSEERDNRIGQGAFFGCEDLDSVSFPDAGRLLIGASAFSGCTALGRLYSSSESLYTVPEGFVFIDSADSDNEQGYPFPSSMYLSFSDKTSSSFQSFARNYAHFPHYYYLSSTGTLEEQINDSHLLLTNVFSAKITDHFTSGSSEAEFPSSIASIPAGKTVLVPYLADGSITQTVVHSDIASGGIVLDSSKKTVTLKLIRDMDIFGCLAIGGMTNYASSFAYQGFIVGPYSELDLNGHQLTVEEGGSLDIAGNLTDSSTGQTGKIIVRKGGKVKTDFALCDFNGGTNTFARLGLGVTPFNFYLMPYLNAHIHFDYGSSLIGYCVLFAGGGHNSIEVPMLGEEEDSPLISWDTDSPKSYLDRTQENYATSVTDSKDLSHYREYLNFVGSFASNSLDFGVHSGDTLIGVTTGLFNFPVSPFIKADFSGFSESEHGKMTLGNTFMLLPGCDVTAERTADVVFVPSQKTGDGFRTGVWGQHQYVSPYSYLATGGITGIFDDFYSRLGTLNEDAVLTLKGNVLFEELNGAPSYVLAGTVSADTAATAALYQSKDRITDEALDILPEGYETLDISAYSVSPLKLNGYVTRLEDSSLKLTADSLCPGVYHNEDSSALYSFQVTEENYQCQQSTVPPAFDYPVAASRYLSNQKGVLKLADSFSSADQTLTVGSQKYAYFNGLFVPLNTGNSTASLRRFVGQTTSFDFSAVPVIYNAARQRWETSERYSYPK